MQVTVKAHFNKQVRDSKKTVLEFVVKGDTSASQTYEFYKRAGSDVNLTITESQMPIEEFEEAREGVGGVINEGGTVDVDDNQMSFDDLEGDDADGVESDELYDEELPGAGDEDDALDNVTDIETARMKRAAGDDDDLPF